ncbi:MAG: DUF971 domain-containing protein [Pseudomonadota bacterium]
MAETTAMPSELRLSKDRKRLTVVFDEVRYDLSAELLRVESPSAEVQGHDPSQKKIIPGKRNVMIRDIETVGNYAVRLVFDDGHETGIYSWDVLNRLGRDADALMETYLAKLGEAGQSR